MDTNEAISLIHYGCNLARDLETNLIPNFTNQPDSYIHSVSKSLDEITKVFGAARDRLCSSDGHHQDPMSSYSHVAQQQQQIDASLQEWLRCNYTQAMEDQYIQTQRFAAEKSRAATPSDVKDSEAEELRGQLHQAMDHIVTVVSHDTSVASSSPSRPRRRKDHGEIHKLTVAAPLIGNTEIPPEDGFTWRKYGQKEIMGCKFPRGYYRCTHQKLYSCPAKKQVQRLDNDPYTFEVVYRGDHTCHMSSTAPSTLPPPADQVKRENVTQPHAVTTTTRPLTTWLTMDFNSRSGGGRDDGDGDGVSTSTMATTRYGKEVEFPVVDFADAMFNSGSSSNNSMDFMFTTPVEKN